MQEVAFVKWEEKMQYKVNENDIIYIISNFLDDYVETRGDHIDISDKSIF